MIIKQASAMAELLDKATPKHDDGISQARTFGVLQCARREEEIVLGRNIIRRCFWCWLYYRHRRTRLIARSTCEWFRPSRNYGLCPQANSTRWGFAQRLVDRG